MFSSVWLHTGQAIQKSWFVRWEEVIVFYYIVSPQFPAWKTLDSEEMGGILSPPPKKTVDYENI